LNKLYSEKVRKVVTKREMNFNNFVDKHKIDLNSRIS